jgi:tetratricopeptide (TPR) repeat protein
LLPKAIAVLTLFIFSFYHRLQELQKYKDALDALNRALLALGKPAEALTLLTKAIALDPNYATAWGVTLYQLELDTEAIASFEKALGINPNYQPALEALEQLKSN